MPAGASSCAISNFQKRCTSVYIEFQMRLRYELEDIKREIKDWANRHQIVCSQKTIKFTHRLGFNKEEHFTLFSLTWNPDLVEKPWLRYKIINVSNERY